MSDEERLDDDQLEEIREIFEHFDRDENGTIDRKEFRRLVEALGGGLSESELEIGLGVVDVNHDGRIQLDEFVRWWADR